jgi:elongation factor P
MATTADFRNGMCIELNNDVYKVIEFLRFQMGRGGAFVRTKLKSTTTGKTIEHTFQSGHSIDEVRIERRPFQFLYSDDTGYVLMDNENFEQISVTDAMITAPQFLREGDTVDVLFHAQKEIPLTVEMAGSVIMEITYCEPGMKGDTATNTLKPATVSTGAEVRVPLFCNTGDMIKIDTETGAYMERVKK